MTVTGHTPGPWHVKDDTSIRATIEGRDVQVALLSPSRFTRDDPHAHLNEHFRDSQAANARLIASAPTAPHECISDCPGEQNRRKIEAHDALLEALEAVLRGEMSHRSIELVIKLARGED